MNNLEVCSLSGNKISSLEDFSHCANLQELYIRKNKIANLTDVHWLKKLNRLRVLWLADNSCATGDNYRMTVLKTLPNLQKLDNVVVTEEEIDRALEEGDELPFPESFVRNESVSGQCLLEQVEMCDELELTREPDLESETKTHNTVVKQTVLNDFKQRFKDIEDCLEKQSEIGPELDNSGSNETSNNIINDSQQIPVTSNETPVSIHKFPSTDIEKTSQSAEDIGNPKVVGSSSDLVIQSQVLDSSRDPVIQSQVLDSSNDPVIDSEMKKSTCSVRQINQPQIKESTRNPVIQPETNESTSSCKQIIQTERSSAPILIFEKGHKKELSKESIGMNPDIPREPPNDLTQSENHTTITKTHIKEEISQSNHRKIPPVALSFEQSNKLREELGLKPLPVDNNVSTMKSIQSGITKAKNANILQATLLLVKDLDKDSLEIVKDVIQTRLDSL